MTIVDILIADDDAGLRELLGELLKRLYEAKTESIRLRLRLAINGREAVSMSLAEPPDFILMDIRMPILDGIEAFYELKEALGEVLPDIFFVSGYARRGETGERVARAIEDGARDFLSKPVPEKELDRIVRSYAV